jgi:hypothetical protein
MGLTRPSNRAKETIGFRLRYEIEKFSFGAGKPDSVPRLAALRPSFLSRPRGPARPPSARRSRVATDGCDIPETMGRAVQSPILSCTGRGFSCRPPRGVRGGLLPHLFTLARRLRGTARRFVFCDTVRRRGLNRAACACLSARAASCPAVSGLSSPNFYRARRYPRLGIKELGATTRPQS